MDDEIWHLLRFRGTDEFQRLYHESSYYHRSRLNIVQRKLSERPCWEDFIRIPGIEHMRASSGGAGSSSGSYVPKLVSVSRCQAVEATISEDEDVFRKRSAITLVVDNLAVALAANGLCKLKLHQSEFCVLMRLVGLICRYQEVRVLWSSMTASWRADALAASAPINDTYRHVSCSVVGVENGLLGMSDAGVSGCSRNVTFGAVVFDMCANTVARAYARPFRSHVDVSSTLAELLGLKYLSRAVLQECMNYYLRARVVQWHEEGTYNPQGVM